MLQEFKLHPNYDFHLNDRVKINNYDGTEEYAVIRYNPETASFILAYYEDHHFIFPRIDDEFEPIEDQIQDIGYEVLKLIK